MDSAHENCIRDDPFCFAVLMTGGGSCGPLAPAVRVDDRRRKGKQSSPVVLLFEQWDTGPREW